MLSGENTSLSNANDIYHFLLRRWKIIFGVIFLGVGIVMSMVLMKTPLYTSTTEIILDPGDKSISNNGELYSGIGKDAAAIGSQVRIIKSASIARRVIADLNLKDDIEFSHKKDPVVLLGPIRLYLYSLFGSNVSNDQQKNTTQQIVNSFQDRLKVDRIGKTYVIAISFTSKNSIKAARIANQVAEAYIVNQFESKFAIRRKVGKWLGERVKALLAKKQSSERAVELYMARHNLIQVNGKAPYEAELEGLNEKLIVARGEMSEKYALYQQVLDVARNNGRLSSVGALSTLDEIKKLRTVRARLAQEEAELITLYTKRHPKVVSKRKERKDLERQMELEARKIAGSIRAEYIASKKKVTLIQNELERFQSKTRTKRTAAMHVLELKREAEADRAIYETFLTRYKNATQQQTLRAADIQVIATAVPPAIPSSPNRKRALFLALLGFAAIGIGIAYLIEALDNSLKTPEDIEQIPGVKYLVSVPKLHKSDFNHEGQEIPLDRYAIMKPLTPYAEAMRTLKVTLELLAQEQQSKVILVTSAMQDEGKSSICANLAQHCSNAGARTLLIDADLRNPSLSRRLGCSQNEGLIELLTHQTVKQRAVFKDHSGLDILSGDRAPYNSAEILGSAGMKSILEELKQDYDIIIMDSSPVMPVIDAKVLMEIADSLVVVAQWNKTPAKALRDIINTLDPEHKKLAGVVLNKVDLKKMQAYGAFGYGRYYSANYYGAES